MVRRISEDLKKKCYTFGKHGLKVIGRTTIYSEDFEENVAIEEK
jgi:hypothetical protein